MNQWDIESPHVFGPDVGTTAALFAAGQNPGRVRSVIVGSGAVCFPLQIGGALKDLVEAPDLAPIAALDPRDIVAGSLELIEKYQLSRNISVAARRTTLPCSAPSGAPRCTWCGTSASSRLTLTAANTSTMSWRPPPTRSSP
jgi:pimeloyl-ACP methyl ester carboxylesterase